MTHLSFHEQIARVAELICESDLTTALTGAGISVDSGIPAFRGAQGLWDRYDPDEYAHIDAFRADPAKVWGMLIELDDLVRGAEPNPAHQALAQLEALGRMQMLATQNVDGLHQAAGSKSVVELHGSSRRLVCLDCGRRVRRAELMLGIMPPRCTCGGLVKPDIIFFGEDLPAKAIRSAMAMASACRLMLVVGTSAVVVPAAHLPLMAKAAGAKVVEINLDSTPLSEGVADYVFHGSASQILPPLVAAVKARLGGRA